jgi:hypothetical protein
MRGKLDAHEARTELAWDAVNKRLIADVSSGFPKEPRRVRNSCVPRSVARQSRRRCGEAGQSRGRCGLALSVGVRRDCRASQLTSALQTDTAVAGRCARARVRACVCASGRAAAICVHACLRACVRVCERA